MRIGIITECYRPAINGVVFSILNFKKALEKRGHEVIVFAPATNQKNGEKDLIGCRTISHPAYPGYGLTLPLNGKKRAVAASLDLIHVQHPFIMGRYALALSRKYHKPLIFTNHTQYDQYYHYIPFLGVMLRGAIESYVIGFISRCDLVIAPSASIKKHLKARQVTRPIEIVPNGIDIDKFAERRHDRLEVRRKLGLDPDTRVILYSGRIALEKNLDFLLDSFKALLNKTPTLKVKLAVAGNGPQEANFRRMVAERGLDKNVVMLGARPHDEMPEVYWAADILATASKTEVHPLTIIEAQASGLPVVALKAMGISDIITHGEGGLLVKENVEDFASTLARLLSDIVLREKMSVDSQAGAARFSIENSTTKLLAAYDLAITEHTKCSRAKT
ncbi:MAG: glycosyltransferase [Actinobacteria bacterium]|nr:glycosyltransferase [Actinomycetota bacterium]